MTRDFKEQFDKWFEDCTLADVEYAVTELDKYGWLDDVKRDFKEEDDGSN